MSIACPNNCTFSRKRLRGWRGGPGRGKLTLRLLEQGKSISHCKFVDFTFLPFTFLPFEGTEQSAGLIQRRRVHRPPVMDWVHPAIRDRVDVL